MRRRPSLFKDFRLLNEAIDKHCIGYPEDIRERLKACALLDSSCSLAPMDEIVRRIVAEEKPG